MPVLLGIPHRKGARVFIASRKEATQAAAEIVRASSRPPSQVFCRGLTADLSKGESEQVGLVARPEPEGDSDWDRFSCP